MSVQEIVDGFGQLIGGELVHSDEYIPVVNPATGEVAVQCPVATVSMVDDAMAAAQAALPAWRATSDEERRRIVQSMALAVVAALPRFEDVLEVERGSRAAAFEAYMLPMFGGYFAEARTPIDTIDESEIRSVTLVRDPVGVVGIIAPWNAPLFILAKKILSALVLGNTVVAKPSPFTPLNALLLAELWREIVPAGVVNILAGGDEIGKAIVAHPTTSLISFTGSVAGGRAVAISAASSLKNVILELGGNDAAIVLDDVDVSEVAPRIYSATFTNAGQACAAIKRLYVHESVKDALLAELVRLAEEDTDDLPLTTRPQFDRVQELVSEAVAQGAVVETGGVARAGAGFFFPPTILTNVTPEMRVVAQEQFGPVLPVIPFTDVEWAISEANDTEFGLSGSVWTKDIPNGKAIAARLDCGTAWVNFHAFVEPQIPFGGIHSSGIGRENGKPGTDAYSSLKSLVVYNEPVDVKAALG